MPYGAAQIALVEQVIAHADAPHLTELAFAARMQATTSYVYGGEPAQAFVTFSWCLAEFDRDPAALRQRTSTRCCGTSSTWSPALTRFPEVPLERTYAVLDDMERRWRDGGHSLHAVYAHRHRVARHVGDLDAAEECYAKWCATPARRPLRLRRLRPVVEGVRGWPARAGTRRRSRWPSRCWPAG